MDYKKVLSAFLKKTLKLSDEEIAEILGAENATETSTTTALLGLDATRVKNLLPKEGETFSDGHKKGKAEALTALETELKEQYGVTSDAKGKELIKLLVKQAEEKNGGKGKEITEDDVRKHPAFVQLSEDLKKKDDEWKQKLADKENSFKSESNRSKAKDLVLSIFEGLNPVLSEDANRAKNQKETFARLTTEGYTFDFVEGQKYPVIMKDGKVQKDAHGNNLDFESFVTDNATQQYDFKGNNGGGNAGNGGGGNGGSSTVKHFTKGMKAEDISKVLDDANIPLEEKEAAFKAWEAENTAK